MLQLNTIHNNTYLVLEALSKRDYLKDFALAGGTSLALQLGHRISIDLDFFTLKEFNSEKLMDQLNSEFDIRDINLAKNTLNLNVHFNDQDIKVEFLRHNYMLLDKYLVVNNIRLYSIKDITAMKLNAIANRGSKKDFFDIYELLHKFLIVEMLDFFKEKYKNYNGFTVIKSLSYFEDANVEPDPMLINNVSWNQVKKRLITEVNNNF